MLNYSSNLFVDYNFKINDHFYQFLKSFFFNRNFLRKKISTYFYEIRIKKIKLYNN